MAKALHEVKNIKTIKKKTTLHINDFNFFRFQQ